MGDVWRLKYFTEESKCRCGRNHNKTLEVDPEDVTDSYMLSTS